MVMGFESRFITITHPPPLLILLLILMSCLTSLEAATYINTTLDDMFQQYAHASLPTRPQTGVLYDASSSLPSNLTGIQVSIVRLRWDSFWRKGANYTNFNMPPSIFSYPYFPRLDIVYSNLRNQSSYYYTLPNHTLVAPVAGFNAYASTTKLNLTLLGAPILVQFPNYTASIPHDAKCVAFYSNGTFELTEIIIQQDVSTIMCRVRDQGHFSIVVQTNSTSRPNDPFPKHENKKSGLWKWWVFGFGVGVLGLLFIGFIVFMVIRFFRMRNIGRMEREADKTEGLETRNVGQSKMPSATVVRTQPTIEDGHYVP